MNNNHNITYKLADGRYWDVMQAKFVASPQDGSELVIVPGMDAPRIKRTLEFYGYTVGPELLTLEEAKAAKRAQIDAETSAAIISGFDYEIDGTPYHFSYDAFDQQNFVDTASMCQLALAGTPGLPESVTWNSYTVPGGALVDARSEEHTSELQSRI